MHQSRPSHSHAASTDAELVDAINTGDSPAFETLYLRHRDWVASLANRFLGDEQAALDVMQETFLHLLGRVPGFELRVRLRTYLYPVVRSLAMNQLRRRGLERRFLSSVTESGAAPAHEVPELRAVLADLSEAHREVLLMRVVDELTPPEIALALSIPEGTVKSRLHHALAALRSNPETQKLLND